MPSFPNVPVKETRFYSDESRNLYYRMNVFHPTLPADALIPELNERHGCRVIGMNPSAMAALMCHSWPGNIRELRNVLERAVIIAREGMLQANHLPPAFGASTVRLPSPSEGLKNQEPAFTFRTGATLR